MERNAYRLQQQQEKNTQRYVALQEQTENPLGLHYQPRHGSPPTYGHNTAFGHTTSLVNPSAPPDYDADASLTRASSSFQSTSSSPHISWSASDPEGAMKGSSDTFSKEIAPSFAYDAPPSYSFNEHINESIKKGEASKRQEQRDMFRAEPALAPPASFRPELASTDRVRCSSCFNVIKSDVTHGRSGLAVRKGSSTYHLECYEKNAAPHCSFCGRTLYPHEEHNLSGVWGIFRGKKYHVECFQYHAGPRCCSCFNVIFANPSKGFSGAWRSLPDLTFIHEECYQRRLANMAR